jgi:hypothetical protein
MATLPEGAEYNGIYCYRRVVDPSTFYYIPGAPAPQRTSKGDPQVSLISMGPMAMLQVGIKWDAGSETLSDVRGQVATKYPELDTSAIQLMPAAVSVTGVTLELKNADGKYDVVGTSSSSGTAPFTAIFSASLTSQQSAQATSALNGRADLLRVVYSVSVDVSVAASATLSGDVAADLQEIDSDATAEDCETALQAGVEAGRLELETSADPDTPDTLVKEVRQQVMDKAADLLHRVLAGSETDFDAAHLKVAVSKTSPVQVALTRTSDAGTWFSGTAAAQHIQVIGA